MALISLSDLITTRFGCPIALEPPNETRTVLPSPTSRRRLTARHP